MSRSIIRVLPFLLPFLHAQEPFRFVAIGDTGSGSVEQKRVAEQMSRWIQDHPFKLVLMLGDNIYGNHEFSGGGDPRFFHDKFDLQYAGFEQQGVEFHAAIGNHDQQYQNGQAEIDDVKRFGILGPEGYYKFSSPAEFDVKGRPLVDFFCINSGLENPEQRRGQVEWFARETAKSKATWKVLFLHEPLYSVRAFHAPAAGLRAQLRESLEKNHVQLVLSGHNHFYARMKPVDGTMQIISGGGGRHLYSPSNDSCAAIVARKYHFTSVEVYSDKIQISAIDDRGEIIDRVTETMKDLQTETNGCPKR